MTARAFFKLIGSQGGIIGGKDYRQEEKIGVLFAGGWRDEKWRLLVWI
jgi:hypothetical protein